MTNPTLADAPTVLGSPADTRSAGPSLLAAVAAGAALALSLGVYGRLHEPTGQAVFDFGFPTVLSMKAWLTTIATSLGLAQGFSALWLFGRLRGLGSAPSWLAPTHRWTGTLAFLTSLPVAYHCLWSLGFQDTTTRVLVHSLLGCAFYGALATKLLALRSKRLPSWALPVFGGVLVTSLVAIWLTSSLWFFTNVGFPGV